MAEFYLMPAVSPTMEVGTIVAWRLAEGQAFEASTVLADVGTDKANMEAEIFESGVLLKRLVAEGDEVPAGFPIAIIGRTADESVERLLADFEARKGSLASKAPAANAPAEKPTEKAPAEATPTAATPPATVPPPAAQVAASSPAAGSIPVHRVWMGKPLSACVADPPGDARIGGSAANQRRIVASPLAKKIAAERGVDLRSIRGTGPGGRIVRADVEGAPVTTARVVEAPRADETLRNTPMRKTIAKRLLQSHSEIPTFFLTVAFDMDNAVALREQLKEAGVRVSYNDLVVRASALALRDVPAANASWGDSAIVRHGRVDIGVAVALPDGLITPVVRGADVKSLAEIGEETRVLANRAKEGKLDPSEYTGGTFTISNLGMMGIEHFTAIINPPEAAILAVGALQQEPVAKAGALVLGHRMRATLTCDHRVLDGAVGATFLQALRGYLERPVRLLL